MGEVILAQGRQALEEALEAGRDTRFLEVDGGARHRAATVFA